MKAGIFYFVLIAIFNISQYEVIAKPPLQIVNGTTAEEGEFPYMVQIRDGFHEFTCGGSIIAPEWILTAGHCLATLGNGSTVTYGTTKLYVETYGIPNNTILVKNQYQHPNFTYTNKGIPIYDIGLVQLSESIPFNEYAQPIQLAVDNKDIPVHIDGILSGWGGINHHGDLPKFLQKINLQLLTDDECTKKINDYSEQDLFDAIHNLCTNDNNNGGCYGDAGSPYVINGTQYGLISWYYKPCYGVVPTAYSRITNPEYINWIKNITNI